MAAARWPTTGDPAVIGLQTLLAATDLSAPSRHAALRGALLAQQHGAGLEILHVLPTRALDELRHFLDAEGDSLQARIRAQASDTLVQWAEELGAPRGMRVHAELREGAVINAIAARAAALRADLLIMGAHGQNHMRHWLLGATSERLLHTISISLLAVKQTPRRDYQSVLVPVDFSPWSRAAIDLARAVAPQAALVLLHVYEMPFEGKMRFAGIAETVIHAHREAHQGQALDRLRQMASEASIEKANWHAVMTRDGAAAGTLE